jgi:diguanylate cyclase (GGDEF)-like protein
MVQLPVSVDLADHADGHGPAWRKLSADDIVVDYILPTLDDRPAYRISTRLSLLEFNAEVEDTALLLFLTHVTSAAIALLLAYLVLMRFLIRPVQRMCANIYRALDTTELPPVSTRGLSEFHQLALSFNRLMEDVHRNRSNLENLSLTDELTQLANRRAFNSMLEREWARSCRYELEISLLLIDIDYFKKYNDHYGHQAGDQVLRQVAEVLRKTVQRREDLAARYGGEEFAIVLATTGLDSALVLAERVRRGVEELAIPHAGSEVADCLTLSIGVASCTPLGSGESGCFVECADRALYRAKEAGRNGLQWIERDELRQCVRVCSEAGCDDNGPTEERG